MPRLPQVSGRALVHLLHSLGYETLRQRGSHIRLKKGNLSVTVPIHPGDLSQTVLRSTLRQAHLIPEEFLKLL